MIEEHKTRKLCYSHVRFNVQDLETIFSEMQIDELDQLPGRKRLSQEQLWRFLAAKANPIERSRHYDIGQYQV